MVDIDVNMNGTGTTVLHWLQPNMQLNAQTNQLSVTGANTSAVANSTAAAYLSPGPPPGPPHRYVQVLFQQPTNFQFPACFVQATQQTGRLGFDINQFVSVAGLQAPVAGNFIQARATAAGPASTPLPTTSSVKSAAGCVATSGPSSARMVKRLEDVLW